MESKQYTEEELTLIDARSVGKESSNMMKAVQKLKESGTDEEYESMIKDMFNSLNRKNQRKLVGKKNRFSHNVSQAIFKKK